MFNIIYEIFNIFLNSSFSLAFNSPDFPLKASYVITSKLVVSTMQDRISITILSFRMLKERVERKFMIYFGNE